MSSLPDIFATDTATVPNLLRKLRGSPALTAIHQTPTRKFSREFTMAWRSHGDSNEEMVDHLARNGLIKTDRVKIAMKSVRVGPLSPNISTANRYQVDRAHYSPRMPYQDTPQSIGHAATISAPHMHANACESLLPFLHPGAKVLDIGSGSGYLTHVLAELVKPGGTVVGVEHIQALADLGRNNTEKSTEGRGLLQNGGIAFVKADGRKGWTGKGGEEGYDAIHVGAAAAGFHQELIDQLKTPGRYVTCFHI